MNYKPVETELRRIEGQERRVIEEVDTLIARADMQQESRRERAVIVKADRFGVDKCPAILADLQR